MKESAHPKNLQAAASSRAIFKGKFDVFTQALSDFNIEVSWLVEIKGTLPRKSTRALNVQFSAKTTVVPFIWV